MRLSGQLFAARSFSLINVTAAMTLHFRETPDKIIFFLTDAKIVYEAEIQLVGGGLLDICERAARNHKRMLVDFRGVQFMGSAMISKLITLSEAVKQHSVDLRLANISPNLLEAFKILQLDKVFRRDDDDPDLLETGVPNPKPPSTLDGEAKSP